jgi:uncharacterized protein (TIGR00251 family)
MIQAMLWIRENTDGALFKVIVQPRGARNQIMGLHGDALKVKLTAPPLEGAANRMCVEFLAKSLKVPKSDIEIVHGRQSRSKTILVRAATRENIQTLLKK